jgi:hypothetical protein
MNKKRANADVVREFTDVAIDAKGYAYCAGALSSMLTYAMGFMPLAEQSRMHGLLYKQSLDLLKGERI